MRFTLDLNEIESELNNMGIVRFFQYFKNQFGENIQNMSRGKTFEDINVEVDILMVENLFLCHMCLLEDSKKL